VPFALSPEGLPVGVQVLAPALGETVMMRVAASLEAAAPRQARGPVTPVTEYETVVGLEVHCELATATKLFCGCRNAFGEAPNTNICPVCLGLPGSLPVINRRAVELALRIGTALNCTAQRSIFHRKNYFYPDMPKDYQISQYDEPINLGGFLELVDGSRVGIERAHMEEDTGKTDPCRRRRAAIREAGYSLVDYKPRRRAARGDRLPSGHLLGGPSRAYVDELRSILVATGASDGRMEEGLPTGRRERLCAPRRRGRVRDPLRSEGT